MKSEVAKRVKLLESTERNGANLISAINAEVIPFAASSINVCTFNNRELNELDQVVKGELRSKNMLGNQ